MFEVGQLVVYGTTGVCRVMDNDADAPIKDMNNGCRYYVLKQLYQEGNIYAPLTGGRVNVRPIISKDEALRLIDLSPSIQTAPITNERSAQLVERYQQILAGNSCEELICLLKTLHLKKKLLIRQHRKFGQVDERYLKRAQTLLHSELAAALEIMPSEVEAFIHNRLGDLAEAQ